MLHWRLLLGTILIAALAGLCWVDDQAATPGVLLFPLALVFAALAAGEMVTLLRARQLRPPPWVIYLGTLLVTAAPGIPMFWPNYPADCPVGRLGWPMLGLALGLLLAVISQIWRYEAPGSAILNLAASVFAMVYVGVLLSFVIQLRAIGTTTSDGNSRWGMVALVSLIAVVKIGDIGAFTVGRLFGRHKMTPVISPGKTWEGLVGGLVFACLGSYLVLGVLATALGLEASEQTRPWIGWIAYGLVVGIAGVLGDLAESLLKRDAGRKDSSDWLPGFGGVLDILDSILAAAPVAYLFWVLRVVGP